MTNTNKNPNYWDLIPHCKKGQEFLRNKFGAMIEMAQNGKCWVHYGDPKRPLKFGNRRTAAYTYVDGKRRAHKIVMYSIFSYLAHGKVGKRTNKCGNPDCVNPYHNEFSDPFHGVTRVLD